MTHIKHLHIKGDSNTQTATDRNLRKARQLGSVSILLPARLYKRICNIFPIIARVIISVRLSHFTLIQENIYCMSYSNTECSKICYIRFKRCIANMNFKSYMKEVERKPSKYIEECDKVVSYLLHYLLL
jgi:hypothetical protein